MATYATLTVPVEDIIGADYDPRRTAVHLETNTPNSLIVVDGTTIRAGGRREKIGTSGTVDFPNLVTTNSASNPTLFAYRVQIVYTPLGSREQKVWTSSDFGLAVSTNLASISEAFDGLAATPTWQSNFIDSAQALLDQQEAIAGLTGEAAAQAYNIENDATVQAALGTSVTTRERRRVPAFDALRTALEDSTRSTAIQIMSDSTGDASNEWPYLFGQALATDHPAWTVRWKNWRDDVQDYDTAVEIQTGTAGARYLDCSTGTTTRRLPNNYVPHQSGVIDVKIRMSVGDWTPAAGKTYIGRTGGEGSRGWYAGLQASTGRPQFSYSTDGNAATLATMTVTAAPTVADGAVTWLRWVFTPNDGGGNRVLSAYQSANGYAWTLLGTTTTAGTMTVFNNSATTGVELGGSASGIGDTTAKIYEVSLASSAGGPNIVPALPDLWQPYNVSAATTVGAPILTVVNAAKSGATISYWSDVTRLAKATPDYGQALIFLSDSHNEGTGSGPSFISTFDTWRAAVETEVLAAPTVVLTQNPESSGTPWYREHAKRRLDLIGYARQKGLGLIDTYQAFLDAGWPGTLMLDDVHPNSAGQLVWRDAILGAYDAT